MMGNLMLRVRLLLLVALIVGTSNAWSFQLSTLSGERDNLQSHAGKGKWTLVMLWSLDCIPCEQQKPMIQSFHDEHASTKAQVVGLALDGVEHSDAIQRRIQKNKTSYLNLIAFSDVIARQLLEETGRSVFVTPSYLLYKPNGEYYGVHTGKLSLEQLQFMTQ